MHNVFTVSSCITYSLCVCIAIARYDVSVFGIVYGIIFYHNDFDVSASSCG